VGEDTMDQADDDLIAFYNSLPFWAKDEFRDVLVKIDRREIDEQEAATVIQNLMDRAERAGDRGGAGYIQ
jgi:lipoprotein NlpI